MFYVASRTLCLYARISNLALLRDVAACTAAVRMPALLRLHVDLCQHRCCTQGNCTHMNAERKGLLTRTLARARIRLYTQRVTQTALVRKKETCTRKKGQWRGTRANANIEIRINITRPCVQGGRGGGNGGRGGGPQNHSQMTHRGGEHDVDPSVYLCTACLIFMCMRLWALSCAWYTYTQGNRRKCTCVLGCLQELDVLTACFLAW